MDATKVIDYVGKKAKRAVAKRTAKANVKPMKSKNKEKKRY